MKKELIIIIFK